MAKNELTLPSGARVSIKKDGGLYSEDLYIDWSPGQRITLDGVLDPRDLIAIANYVKKVSDIT